MTALRNNPFLACAAFALLALGGFATGESRAEPYLAIQEGYKCSKCHVNVTGGGKRTDFANIYVQTRLAANFVDWRSLLPLDDEEEDNPPRTDSVSSFFSGRLNDYIAIGADLRGLYELTDTPNLETEQVFNQRKQNIYLQIDLIPERVMLYQTLSGGGDAREIFALVNWRPSGNPLYLKAGEFFLPYGLRLLDDTAFTRAVTGFTYGTTDTGLEIGYEPGNWAMHLAATNGTGTSIETNQNKRLTGSVAYVHRRFRVGASFSTNEDAQGVETRIYGLNGGAQFGRFGILAEADIIDDSVDEEFVSILEFNLLISRGNTLKLTYEYYDPAESIAENARDRLTISWEPFLNQFTQFRVGVRENRGIPQADTQNTTEAFVELHLFM